MAQDLKIAELVGLIHELRAEVARLGERISALEGGASAPPSAAVSAKPAEEQASEGLSPELILVIGAAVAGYLGKRAPIRQIRLLGSAAWAQQGRVTIQASHTLQQS